MNITEVNMEIKPSSSHVTSLVTAAVLATSASYNTTISSLLLAYVCSIAQ